MVKKTLGNPKNGSPVGDGTPGPGRPKGIPNKITGEVKGMIVAALRGVGGEKYLQQQARENPAAFMSLVGRIVPTEVHGPGEDGEHKATFTLRW